MPPSTRPPPSPRKATILPLALVLVAGFLLLPATFATAQRSAMSATTSPSLADSRSQSARTSQPPQSASSSIATGTLTTSTRSAIVLPTHTMSINGTITAIVGNKTLSAIGANSTAPPSPSPHSSPSPALSDLHHVSPPGHHPPTPTKPTPNPNHLHGVGDKSVDPTSSPGESPLTIATLGGKYTALAAASIGGLLMVMASAGAIGIRRSSRSLHPHACPSRACPSSACSSTDLVDRYLALERSPAVLAWICRGIPNCQRGQNPTDAAIAYALGVSVDELPRLKSQARSRAMHGGSVPAHQPIKRESLARRLLRSTVMMSGWTTSLGGRMPGVAGAGKAQVSPVPLARNGPVPPVLEARELMRLRRRKSDAGKVSAWEPPMVGSATAISTSFQSRDGAPTLPPQPLPPFPVSTRAAVMRVGSDRGSMDTELSDTYVAPRRKDLLPRHPTSTARAVPFLPVTTDHLHHFSSPSTSHASNRHSSSSTSSSSDPPASLQDVLDPAMIVAEYGAVRLSPPPTLANDLLPDGRPRAQSLPAGMLRYAAYMAAQRHAAKMRREQLRAARRGPGHLSNATEDDLVSEDEVEGLEDKQIVDGEGNLIVAPVYRLPANRGARPLAKPPSVSTMRRGSASTATASLPAEPDMTTSRRPMPATLAIPRTIDPDADTDIDAFSSPAVSMHHARSRATSVSFSYPLPPMPATMPLPPTSASTADDRLVDSYAHHEWHAAAPELAGAFPRRRASDVSTDLSSIIVVLDDDDRDNGQQLAARHAFDVDNQGEAYELQEIVVGAPELAHVRSVSSPVQAHLAMPAPGAAVAMAAAGGFDERARSLSPPAAGGAARQGVPMPPLVRLTRPWPAAHLR